MEDDGLSAAERLSPLDARAQKIDHLMEVERFDLAEVELVEALAEEPDEPLWYQQLAFCRLQQKRPKEALELTDEGLAREPNVPQLHLMRALALRALDRSASAERALLECLKLDPWNPGAFHLYADLMHDTGHFEKALELVDRSLALAPNDPPSKALRGLILNSLGRGKESSANLDQAIAQDPDDDGMLLISASRSLETGHPFRARAQAFEALRRNPNDREVLAFAREVDMVCRVPVLPGYFATRAMDRIPGSWFTVWLAFIVFTRLIPEESFDSPWVLALIFGYVAFAIYTWIADPIGRLWVKLFPPKFASR